MKAIIIRKYGKTDVLELAEIPKPESGVNQVLVKVHAAGINPIDLKMREGIFKILPGRQMPIILGCDFSGVVAEVGSKVTDFKTGDEVYSSLPALKGQGSYAEYAVIDHTVLCAKPNNIDHPTAAGIPIAGLTALQGLRSKGNIQPGMKVLINGASGGVGHFAIQLAKHFETEVTGVSSKRNLEFVKSLGADHVIDYKEEDFTKQKTKYDIIFDVVGNKSFGLCKKVMTKQSTYINTLVTPKRFVGRFLTAMSGKKLKTIVTNVNREELKEIKVWIEDGTLKVHIDKTFALEDIKPAHEYMESGRVKGKVVIKTF